MPVTQCDPGIPPDAAMSRGGLVPDSARLNVSDQLDLWAHGSPNRPAVVVAQVRRGGRQTYGVRTFGELNSLAHRCASGLAAVGVERGHRVLLMVPPGFEFVALVFGLFRLGAVPVLIDPGMGVRRLLDCVRNASPQGMIAVSVAQVVRLVRPRFFESLRYAVNVGRRWFPGGRTLEDVLNRGSDRCDAAHTTADDPAAILFTSGATGPAKGVVYTHGMLATQIRMIQGQYGMKPGDVELATFPLFALTGVALGMTTVFPKMDASRPGRVKALDIIEPIRDLEVTGSFGSPALWSRVVAYGLSRGLQFPLLRRVLVAGAAVRPELIRAVRRFLAGDADVHTPYGATEALPVSSISGMELISSGLDRGPGRGAGTCVGRPLPGSEVRVIRMTDDAIPEWSNELTVDPGTAGEIVVRGPMVTRAYFGLPEATRLAKIVDGVDVWHRMGDVGYFDGEGRLWYCGRKSQRIMTDDRTYFADRCEGVFNEHGSVRRSALVGVGSPGRQKPVLVVEPVRGRTPGRQNAERMRSELLDLARSHPGLDRIHDILFHPDLPTDARHNAKINRERLAEWASRRVP